MSDVSGFWLCYLAVAVLFIPMLALAVEHFAKSERDDRRWQMVGASLPLRVTLILSASALWPFVAWHAVVGMVREVIKELSNDSER